MRWLTDPFKSGDFGENGRNGEQSPIVNKVPNEMAMGTF